MSCSTLTSGPLRAASTLHPTQLLWTRTHHPSSNTDTALSYVHSLAITTVLCCPFIAPSAPNMITALHLILHLPVTLFFLYFSPHTIPDSVFSRLLCHSVSLSSSLLADTDCLCNVLKMSWVAIQSKLLCVVLL